MILDKRIEVISMFVVVSLDRNLIFFLDYYSLSVALFSMFFHIINLKEEVSKEIIVDVFVVFALLPLSCATPSPSTKQTDWQVCFFRLVTSDFPADSFPNCKRCSSRAFNNPLSLIMTSRRCNNSRGQTDD